ncbi:hypothetical protein [Micromonospora sp. NPDC049102]|uniref:hypothetical protein n=1 Tax=Micromonospora sp. NPDC049102 TaxID=3364265 RepID=UPI0037228BBB
MRDQAFVEGAVGVAAGEIGQDAAGLLEADRLDFAAAERSTVALAPAEKEQFAAALHVDDPRWILNLVIFAVLLLSAFFSRLREVTNPIAATSRRIRVR